MPALNFQTKYLPLALILLFVSIGTQTLSAQKRKEVKWTSGAAQISGTIFYPKGQGPHPLLLSLPGSGPSLRSDTKKRTIQLLKHGFAVLVYDKRGVGKSTGDKNFWRYYHFDTLAQDAHASRSIIEADVRIDSDNVGLLAASQSGWVASKIMNQPHNFKFLICISCSVSTVAEDNLFERSARLLSEGFTPVEVNEARQMHLLDIEASRSPTAFPDFQLAWREHHEKKWFSSVYPMTSPLGPKSAYRQWYKTIMDYNPLDAIKNNHIPSLWIYGSENIDTFCPIQLSLARLNDGPSSKGEISIHQYAQADHNLNGAAYIQPLVQWIRQHVQLK